MEVTPEIVGGPDTEGTAEHAQPKEAVQAEQTQSSGDSGNIFSQGANNESNNESNKTESEESGASETGAWFLSEGVEGEGEPPEWFISNKYKSVADQAKAAKELRTEYNKMQEKMKAFTGAPENYDFEALPEGIDKSSPMLERFSGIFKDMGMSQEGFEAVTKEFMATQIENAQISPQEIIKDIGPEGPEVFDRVSNWARNTFSQEEQAVLSQLVTSGDGLLLLDKLRGNTKLSRLPNQHDLQNVQSFESSSKIKAEKRANIDKYMTDQNYAKEISRRLQTALIYEGKSNVSSGRR